MEGEEIRAGMELELVPNKIPNINLPNNDYHKITQVYIMSSNMIHQKKKTKKEISNN